MILHIETSTEVCGVALADQGILIALKETDTGLVHAEALAVFIREIFQQTGVAPDTLTAVAISIGPGSYTGLRVGLATAKGLAMALEIPILPLKTLDLLIHASRSKFPGYWYMAALDARRQEVYARIEDPAGKEILSGAPVVLDGVKPDLWFPDITVPVAVSGNSMEKIALNWPDLNLVDTQTLCSAAHMVQPAFSCYQTGNYPEIAALVPNYLKEANITTPKSNFF